MKRMNFVLIAITALLLTCCGPSNVVKVSDFSPTDEVENLTTFTIEFSEDLAPGNIQNKWLTDEFVKFEPKIDGKFKWTSANTLIFSPDFPLEPIQQYSAKITNKVLFNTTYSPDFDEYDFHTPDFDATKADFFWTHIPNREHHISIQTNIYFNYPVAPDMLKQFLSIEIDDKAIYDYKIVSDKSSNTMAINLGEIEQTDDEQNLTIKIKEGLESVVGKKPLQDTREFDYELPPITQLAITGVSSGFDGENGWIEISTTQQVDEKKLKDFVTVKPAANIRFFVSGNRFRIEGALKNLQSIELKIANGLPGLYGGKLEYDFDQMISLVNLKPAINFADKKGKYLMLGGEQNLSVNSVNIPEVDIEVSKVYKNNLVHFLNRYSYYYDYYGDYNPYYRADNFGNILYTETIELDSYQNWLTNFSVNLDSALTHRPERKGLFLVSARSAKDRWINDSKMVSISDLGIIAKTSHNEIIVFINSISEAEPVEGVTVDIISTNNQTILSGKTGADGAIHFKNIKQVMEDFRPRLVVAEKGDDFNYIDLIETGIETSRFDVGGITEYSADYNAFIYSERNLYRPGDKVNLSAIIRNDKIKTVNDIPVIVKIISPNGKVFDEFKKTLNKEGSFELGFTMPVFAQTGEYVAEVYSGSSTLTGAYKFSLEDFVPDKIRVTLKNDKQTAYPGETVPIGIEAEFLFGAKAGGLKYETNMDMRHRPYRSKTYPKFDFANSSIVNTKAETTTLDGTLDDEGKGNIKYIIPNNITSSGIATGYAYVSVFDLTGRTVNRVAAFDIFPKKYFVGIKSPGYYFGTNKNLTFQMVAVNEHDKPINHFTSNVSLVKLEWQTVLKKDYNDRYYYASEKKEVVVWEREFDISGEVKNFTFNVDASGQYELRVAKKGSNDYQRKEFYAYGWGSGGSSFEVDKEGRVDIVFDKELYQPGDNAKILFMAPFAGKLLVTVERNGVYDYQYINMEDKSAQLTLPVTEAHMPNAYVTATLFKKHKQESAAPFLVGHGFASMKVEKKANRLPVEIIAPAKIKPNTTQAVTIKTVPEKNVYVTLAAVDEGILQIKNFVTPDPYGYMYAKRSLKVESHDLYKLLLPEILSSSTGGDALAAQLKKRTNPITTKRFKLLSYWSGIRKTDENGNVTVKLNIPQFNGDVRLMAVAYSGNRFGNAGFNMKVADDLIIEPEIPRFLSQNDSLVSNVTIINTTSSEGKVVITLKVDGPLKITSVQSQSVTVEANSTAQVSFAIAASSEIGKGKITFETSGMANVKEEIEIGIRPVSPLITESGNGIIKAGETKSINIPGGFLKGTQKTSLIVSKFPAIKFAEHLKYLVGYPYGCIEQTVSKVFPQLYFGEIAKLAAPELYRTHNPAYYVKEGIKKIEAMQLWDGSMSYWQGSSNVSWWGSVYAAHFLIEAKKAGFAISDDVLSKLLNYIDGKAKAKSTYDYTTYEGNRRTVKKTASKEILYSLYVLALAGQGDIATMNYYQAKPHLLTSDTKYLLAGAYALMGKWNAYHNTIPQGYDPEKTDRQTGGSFDSEIRANAIMLNVLLEVDPGNTMIPLIIKHLTQSADKIYSTQERSFVFLGLGKAAKRNADTDIKVSLIVDGKTLAAADNKDLSFNGDELNTGKIKIKAEGNGETYFFWNTEGVKLNEKVEESDSFMKVRRTYYDYRTGAELHNQFRQGQLVVCKISLTGYQSAADNIVIADLIPAGFEIENPRLSEMAGLIDHYKGNMDVEYLNVRDDRLLLFTGLKSNYTKHYYYMLRVVNKGKFQLPVIGAEAMYDKEFNSYHGAKIVNIKE